MIAAWMLYSVAIACALTLAGILTEPLLRRSRLPLRAVWLLVMLGALLPLTELAASRRSVERTAGADPSPSADSLSRALPAPTGASLRRPIVGVPADTRLTRLDAPLAALWAVMSLATLALFCIGAVRLQRVRSIAIARWIGGTKVLVTEDVGPLAMGLRKPVILVPRWVLALPAGDQELLLAHEAEHARARDPALLMLSALLVALAPWNPLLWYARRRLQAVLELDCDRRVLAARPDRARYADLLLSTAGRATSGLVTTAGFAAPAISLERRIRTMLTSDRRIGFRRLAISGASLVMLLGFVALAPHPVATSPVTVHASAPTSGRATGRVRVSFETESMFTAHPGITTGVRIYAEGASFRLAGEAATVRRDTLTTYSPSEVLDVDVTDGAIHFVTTDSSVVHIEAAMSGDSPALWLSASGPHIVLDRGGSGDRVAKWTPPATPR